MRHFLMTTALILPLAAGPVFAQTATTPPPPADQTTTQPAADAAADAANDAAEAADEAAEAAGDAAAEADAAADAASDATAPAADAPATDAAPAPAPAADAPATDAAPVDDKGQLEAAMATSDKVVREQAANELRVDWITGTTVKAPDGESVGSIKDIIVDGSTGQMSAAIIGVGGFLGIGEKQIAVPWDQLTINYDAEEITTDLTRDEAKAAPEYVFRDRESAPPASDTAPAPVDTTPAPADSAASDAAPADSTAPATSN